jgi:micrococcal nuclease
LKSVSGIIIGIIIGIGIGYYLWHTDSGYTGGYELAVVSRVIDGDTVELNDGRRVRYIGVDTPEAAGSPKGEQPYAKEATARNRQLVEAKKVELQRGERDTDDYGRFLRYVYVDGVFVNAELIAEGFGYAYVREPGDRYRQVFVQLEQYAKLKKVGMWSGS